MMEERVLLSKLLKYGSLIESETFMRLLDLQLGGVKYVNIPYGTIAELERRKQAQKESERLLNKTAKRNTRGKALEKDGKTKAAVALYEKNIENGYPAHHSYKRLMIIYHKTKDYENELRVIYRAIEVFGEYPEYIARMEKVNKLIKESGTD